MGCDPVVNPTCVHTMFHININGVAAKSEDLSLSDARVFISCSYFQVSYDAEPLRLVQSTGGGGAQFVSSAD